MADIRALAVVSLYCLSAAFTPGATARQRMSQEPIRSGFGVGAYPVGAVYPSLSKLVQPKYPDAAIRAGIEGEVLLEAVVGPKGTVTDVRVTKSLDAVLGVDDSAVAAVRQWKFKPGQIGADAVAAIVAARVAFYLHRPGKPSSKPFVESGLMAVPEEEFPADVAGVGTPGLTSPTVVRQVRPQYTSEAMREKIQGTVTLEVVIGTEGKVTAARVLKSLDSAFGLDRQALACVRQWTFTPARRNGVPVPVKAQVVLEFRLH